jgi:hypothetical protein
MRKHYGVKEERNILPKIKRKRANWIGYISTTNCLLKHIITGKIQGGAGRREEKEGDVSSCWIT